MYRSQSTSSVFFDTLHHSDGRSWTAVDPSEYGNGETSGASARLSSTSRRTPEAPVTVNTLTSALTGSKMATHTGIPTGTSKRPLPKALLPKSARTPATPPVMVGSSYGLNSPDGVRRGSFSSSSFSSSLTPTVAKSLTLPPERRVAAAQRLESTPVCVMSSLGGHQVTESDPCSSARPRPQTAGIYPPGSWTQRPLGVSVDTAGRDSRDAGRLHSVGHPVTAWNSLKVTPVRRREPVVQDSIMPILKAALGKDNDQQDKRIDKEEEAVNRQVFGRAARAGPGTPRTLSLYGSTDDVFARSNSYLQGSPSWDATIPRVHLKSHSEVLPPTRSEELQRKALRNSLSSAVSTPNINGMKILGAPGVQGTPQKEFSSYAEAQSPSISQNLPPTPSEGLQHPRPSSRPAVPSYGMKPTPAELSSRNSPRFSSNSMHPNETRPSPARLPSWDPTPPHSAPPIPSYHMSYLSTDRSFADMANRSSSWYDPVPIQPRKTIRNPSVDLQSPRSQKETMRSSRSLVFFGESFSPASYPLLAKVETEILADDADSIGTTRDSRDAGSKDTAAVGWKEPGLRETSTKKNGLGYSKASPAEVVSVTQRTSGVENIPVPPPPFGFRDDTTVFSSSLATTTAKTTTTTAAVNIPPLTMSHQATDSINTEDSGLDRWEKEGNDHSADELETSAGHTSSAAAGDRSSAAKRRSGSWREDVSEGRGSLTSSPRPHNSDEQWLSPTNEPFSNVPNSNGFVEDKTFHSNNILHQLLAESGRQKARNSEETTLTSGSEREPRSMESKHHLHHSKVTDTEAPLPPSVPPPSDFDSHSTVSTGGIDSESCYSFSTAVQSTVTVSGGSAVPGKWPRLTEDAQREHEEETLRGSAAEDETQDEGSLKERCAVVSDAGLDLGKPLILLPGVKETQDSSRKLASFEASQNGTDRRISLTKKNGGEEEKKKEEEEEAERMVFEIAKGSVGVGFSIEGGKGSLSGDRPIAVKRVFKGGLTEGAGNLRPGDELLSIGVQSLVDFSHFEAWKYIKALPNGTVSLVIRRRRETNQQPQLL